MTSLWNISGKNATLRNGVITTFIAIALNKNQQHEYLQGSIPLEKVERVAIILAILYGIYAICALWTLRRYLRAHVVHSEQWKAFVEFPVIHHACHVIRKFYSVSLVLNSCLSGVLCYIMMDSGLNSVIWMVIGGILAIVVVVYSAIVTWFVQVYQILIALEIFNGLENSDEQLMGPELEARQMEKEKIIRTIYKIFLLRDLVVIPVLVFYDSYEILIDVRSGKNVLSLGSGITMVVWVLTSTSINLVVPLSMACYVVNKIRNSKTRKNPNPLQRIISCQAVLFSTSVMTALVINFTLSVCNVTIFSQGPFKIFSIAHIPPYIELSEKFIPLYIMSMTLFGCKKIEKGQVSTSANFCKVEPLAIVGDIENPPIQNS